MRLTRAIPLLMLVAIAPLALASCGGGGNGGNERTGGETVGKGDGAVSGVVMTEFAFEPSDVTAKRGSTITVKNEGTVPHDLKLRKNGEAIGGTKVFEGGKSVELKIDFAPGKYEMFCTVPGHEDSGMKGTFTVD